MKETNEEIRLDTYFAAIWRGKWLIALGVVAAAAVVAAMTLRQPTLHKASASIKVGRVWKEPLEDPSITARLASSPGFLQELSEKMGLRSNQLRRSIETETILAGPRRARYPILVNITATTDNPAESVRRAQAVAASVVEKHERLFNDAIAPHLERQRRIERHLADAALQAPAAREMKIRLEDELDQVKANNSSPNITEKTSLADRVVEGEVISPPILRNVATAAIIAALVGLAAAALVGHFKPVRARSAAK